MTRLLLRETEIQSSARKLLRLMFDRRCGVHILILKREGNNSLPSNEVGRWFVVAISSICAQSCGRRVSSIPRLSARVPFGFAPVPSRDELSILWHKTSEDHIRQDSLFLCWLSIIRVWLPSWHNAREKLQAIADHIRHRPEMLFRGRFAFGRRTRTRTVGTLSSELLLEGVLVRRIRTRAARVWHATGYM